MKSQINLLRQLQELVLTRDEHMQVSDGSHLDSLNDSIDDLRAKIAPQAAGIYDRLYKRTHVTIAAMSNGCCAACGMQVPIAQAQQVRLARHLVTCSGCGRILFADETDAPRHVPSGDAKASHDEPPKTGISRFSAEELMIADLKGRTPAAAITELANAMEAHHFIQNADTLVTAALERESLLTTATEEGIAFPHVRGVEGGGLTLAMGISREGVDWDGTCVNIVCLAAIPVAVSAFYMRLLSGLSQTLSTKANRQALLAAADAPALWKAIVKATRSTIK